ncbi:hypothetical protein N0V88_006848 [Collariella sp. IMI 366227]|nr:hypothetical protein N0V88_006848 [Collariella sp. IMI 366227]
MGFPEVDLGVNITDCAAAICVNNCDRKADCDPGGFGKGFDIPLGVYTYINFVFASINPVTFDLVPAAKADIDLYTRMAAFKGRDPRLKVMIAVGGWTFNDPGPMVTTFSDIAWDEAAQRKFIDSVKRFLQTYNFDGIDLDWEYPGAPDRNGRGEDFANFPKFIKRLREGLKGYEVSITLPAFFWYLQHFDIKNLEPHVDFFNMMTYDFHGVWDKPNKWVTLGLAFYARGFVASSASCLAPGCTFESGTAVQICSNEPTLNQNATVKILTWGGNNWLTYDDEKTLKMKRDFARSQCLGGVMVWAISHDTKDAKYSKALGRAAPRLFPLPNSLYTQPHHTIDITEQPQYI